MKRYLRPIAYSTIVVLAALALFGGQAPADTATVEAVEARPRSPVARAERKSELPAVREREDDAFPVALFTADAALPAPAVVSPAPAAPVSNAPADLKVLGWMQSGSVPHVFVEWSDTSYTLKQTDTIENLYRFDEIGGGFANFTYLPTGESRRYAVSDPALLE